MARGVNKVILVGHLGNAPESRQLPSGGIVANCNLATNKVWTDNSGQQQEKTEWHRIVFFSRLAEIAIQYLTKGRQIYVEGELRTNKWEKDGITRYTTEIIVREMQMLGSAPQGSSYEAPAPQSSSYEAPAVEQPMSEDPPAKSTPAESPFEDQDDDIPSNLYC